MNLLFSLFLIIISLNGCVSAGHLIVGRQWLYFDGAAAKNDLWVKGEEKEFIKKTGDPDAYKWEKWPAGTFKSVWLLNLYYGDTVYIFKDHVYYGKRQTWEHEFAFMKGYYGGTKK